MANLNKVLLIGNLTRDPEVRYTTSGAAVANFGLAVNERYRTAQGVDKEDTCFVELEVWGKQAETLKQYTRKGDPLFVEGRLRLDTWQDKETGRNRSTMRVRVDRFQFLSARTQGGNGGQQQYAQPAQQVPQQGGYQQPQGGYQQPPQQQFAQPAAPAQHTGAPMPPPPSFGSKPAAPASTMPAAPTFQPIDEPEDDIPF